LEENIQMMQEVVVVGYGIQKKASVVGSITQTSGKVLERTGGVTNLEQALTSNLPSVITSTTTGMPGVTSSRKSLSARKVCGTAVRRWCW
jgi:hypothetical protein